MSMRIHYKYVYFKLVEEKPKTRLWSCHNKKGNDELGIVKWYPVWRRYCYFPTAQAVYSAGCLNDIQNFIGKEMQRHREATRLLEEADNV